MATAVTVKADFSTDELRRLAAASKHANQSQRAQAELRTGEGVNRVNEITPPAGTATASIEQSR